MKGPSMNPNGAALARDHHSRVGGWARREDGLTLLEIMVVVFIIGIILSFAVLRVSGRSPDEVLRREAQRFGALLNMAQEQAILEAREYSVTLSEDSYGFMSLEEDSWEPVTEDDLFRKRQLPEGMTMELTADELPVKLTRSATADDFAEEKRDPPQILLLSSGELTPFALVMYVDFTDLAYRIEGQLDGSIAIERLEFR